MERGSADAPTRAARAPPRPLARRGGRPVRAGPVLGGPVRLPGVVPAGALVQQTLVELPERLDLDLADALARQPDLLADLLERQRLLAVEPEAETEDGGLTLIDRVEFLLAQEVLCLEE